MSSLRVGDARVTLYKDKEYRGQSMSFGPNVDIYYLGDRFGNDAVRSMTIADV